MSDSPIKSVGRALNRDPTIFSFSTCAVKKQMAVKGFFRKNPRRNPESKDVVIRKFLIWNPCSFVHLDQNPLIPY